MKKSAHSSISSLFRFAFFCYIIDHHELLHSRLEMTTLKLSKLVETLTSRSISNLSEKVERKIQQGEKVYNFTLGDYCPKRFSIPKELEDEVVNAYRSKYTNYPFVSGIDELRSAISKHIKIHGNFDYEPDEIVVASGARPLIYLLFRALVDPGEKVIYTTPSWNNQYFIHLASADPIIVEGKPENNFLIDAKDLKPHLKEAVLINLNSPLNPSGTILKAETLKEIFDLIVAENEERVKNNRKPLYVFFDIIYWFLIYNSETYINPANLNPKIRDYLVFVDGISKCFAATGVRVGWAFGPKPIINSIRSLLAHIGAWPPKPEQVATAKYLENQTAVTSFLNKFKQDVFARLNTFYDTIQQLKNEGYKVDVTEPQGAIYLALKLDIIGQKTPDNKTIDTVDDILLYILDAAKMAVVPFYFFGLSEETPWFRLSVGTCSLEDAKVAAKLLIKAIKELK